MKTKTILFNVKMAKDIQDGKIEGKIKQLHGEEVEIICWDLENTVGNNLAVKHKYFSECGDDCGIHVDEYNAKGEYWDRSDSMAHNDLVLEVLDDEPQFKPFDRELALKAGTEAYYNISTYIQEGKLNGTFNNIFALGAEWMYEYLVGTTKPKEE